MLSSARAPEKASLRAPQVSEAGSGAGAHLLSVAQDQVLPDGGSSAPVQPNKEALSHSKGLESPDAVLRARKHTQSH